MEQNRAGHAFATLGHPGRMAVFRLLMRFAPQGVRPTEIAEARWFARGDPLPELPPPQSVARALIEANLPR